MNEVLTAGQIFATRYRIERFLAKGGFGAVYVAEQLATELRVALKVLWPHVLQSKDAVDKFQQEARIAGRVNSEHIVRVIDAGFDPESKMPFLVMELLDGMDLERVVRDAAPLEPSVATAYLRQVGSALDKAHRHVGRDGFPTPIVHRDLKPENLFLCQREDGSPLVKVLDFGIAKVLNESTKMSQDVKGTPLYMAFEQFAGGAITPSADIWALGLIAFFLMSGKEYWRAAHEREGTLMLLMGEVLTLPIDSPSVRLRELGGTPSWSAGFDAWFAKCVHRDAAARFASAGEAIDALARTLESQPPAVQDHPASSSASPLSAVDLRPVQAARTLPSSPPSSTVIPIKPRLDLAESAPATVLPPRSKTPGLVVAGLGLAAVVAVALVVLVMHQRSTGQTPIADTAGTAPAAFPTVSSHPSPSIGTDASSSAPAASAPPMPSASAQAAPTVARPPASGRPKGTTAPAGATPLPTGTQSPYDER